MPATRFAVLNAARTGDKILTIPYDTPWRVVEQREVYRQSPRLVVSVQRIALPDGREVDGYLRLTIPSYVTILALTETGRILAERQYKHGPGRPTLTLPAGMIEAGEAPDAAARRELLEETGYTTDDWAEIAIHTALGNMAGPSQHLFVARGCHRIAAPNSGDLEAMEIVALSPADLLAAVLGGEVAIMGDALGILHGLVSLGHLSLTGASDGAHR
jgi:ADP-ribose pyrophosphatase